MAARTFGVEARGWWLAIALGVSTLVPTAFAQDYVGDAGCIGCHEDGPERHPDQYNDYMKHGHKWMLVHTAGQNPTTGDPDPLKNNFGFASVGVGLPALPTGKTWADIEYLVGNFNAGTGRFVGIDGRYINANGTAGSNYSCAKCHTTGYDPNGHQKNHLGNEMWDPNANNGAGAGAVGTWQLDGIQCERCHGPGANFITGMKIPQTTGTRAAGNLCHECHTGDDSQNRNKFDATLGWVAKDGQKVGLLSNNHPQGDEFITSPHVNLGCVGCHDPHKSVWHDEGGVALSPTSDLTIGNMCLGCHKHQNMRIRGGMGEMGLECVDCHMPYASIKGAGASHFFKINATALTAKQNTFTANNDSGVATTYYKLADDGKGFLTLDLVCSKCHPSTMTMTQMARAAKSIHRMPGLVDLTVNHDETIQFVQKTDPVSVAFSVEAGKKAGKKATVWIMCQGPKGLQSYNLATKKWRAGYSPATPSNYTLADIDRTEVFNAKLKPGFYTYFVWVDLKDGSKNTASVPVWVGN